MAEKCCDITSSIITGRIAVTPKESNLTYLAEYLLLDRHNRILLVRKKYNSGLNYVEIASKYDIGISTVRDYVEMKENDIPPHSTHLRERPY